jgi:hypothetical protein
MGSAEAAGNTRLRSARQALGLRSQQQLAEAINRAGRPGDRPADLDHGAHGAALGIRQSPVAAPRPSGSD